MADFNRKFKKANLMTLVEGDWDGALERDQPEYKVVGWHVDAKAKTVQIMINFLSPQGNRVQDDTRTVTIDLTTVPAAARKRFLDQYNFITDNIMKVMPELADGVEQ